MWQCLALCPSLASGRATHSSLFFLVLCPESPGHLTPVDHVPPSPQPPIQCTPFSPLLCAALPQPSSGTLLPRLQYLAQISSPGSFPYHPPAQKTGLAAPPLGACINFVGITWALPRFCISSSPIQHGPQGHGLHIISSLPVKPYKLTRSSI